jgi:hypothetical protein
MTRPKRFRGMELTEEEVCAIVLERGRFWPSLPKREKRLARAKRLLPLWRKLGLQALYNQGHQAACVGYEHAAMRRIEGSK